MKIYIYKDTDLFYEKQIVYKLTSDDYLGDDSLYIIDRDYYMLADFYDKSYFSGLLSLLILREKARFINFRLHLYSEEDLAAKYELKSCEDYEVIEK